MVSGTTFLDGDPFMQRQNEPSIAVSTRNPLHLFGAANDYRTVDIPGLVGDVTGDAWIGVFKSFDGGATWRSTLLPGSPLDGSPQAATSPLKGLEAGADPVVRAGTNGLFYLSGMAFNRASSVGGKVFVARYIDNNNLEAGDPFAYLGTSIIDVGTETRFLDKPWIAVDIPRGNGAGNGRGNDDKKNDKDKDDNGRRGSFTGPTCQIPGQAKPIPAGPVYVMYSVFINDLATTTTTGTSNDPDRNGDDRYRGRNRRRDHDWDGDRARDHGSDDHDHDEHTPGQPLTGRTQIMFSRSLDCGLTFSTPRMISDRNQINQGSVAAIDPNTGAIYIAWREFMSPLQPDAILVTKSVDSGVSFSEPVTIARIAPFDQKTSTTRFRTNSYPTMTVDGDGRVYVAWAQRNVGPFGDARIVLSTSPDGRKWTAPMAVDNHAGHGHQFMPVLSSGGGKLHLVYWDQRDDRSGDWGPEIDDAAILAKPAGELRLRHTLDLYGASGLPGNPPQFGPGRRLSDYPMGSRNGSHTIEQLAVNAPNLPLFNKGTQPFIGDYLDVTASPNFILNADGTWRFNTEPSDPSIYFASWSDNRDVRAPADRDWTHYTAPTFGVPAGTPRTSKFDPSQLVMCTPGQAGMRNQNVYSTRVATGMSVSTLGNNKPLGYVTDATGKQTLIQRTFVVTVTNPEAYDPAKPETKERAVVLHIPSQPAGGHASFLQFSQVADLPVKVAAKSTISREVFVTSTDRHASIAVTVDDSAHVTIGTVVFNGDATNPDILNPDILNPDILNPDILNAEAHAVTVSNPDILNRGIRNPDILNPDILNPDILNPDILNPDILNPDILNPDILNPDILNPDILNPDILNPDILNPDILNTSLTDVTWNVANVGNTATSYQVKMLLDQAAQARLIAAGVAFQLIITKTTNVPVVIDQCTVAQPGQNITVASINNPTFVDPKNPQQFATVVNPDILNANVQNATVALAPGEKARVTLRILSPAGDSGSTTGTGGSAGGGGDISFTGALEDLNKIGVVTTSHPVDTVDVNNNITVPQITASIPLIVTTTLPDASRTQPYNAAIDQTGATAPFAFTIASGSLPPGLTLSPTGAITGAPSASGAYTFGVLLTDANAMTATATLTIRVFEPVVVAAATLTEGAVNQPYTATVSAAGGFAPYGWAIASGALPSGLSLSPAGVIAGTPTQSGAFTFTARATDAASPSQIGSGPITVNVAPAANAQSVTLAEDTTTPITLTGTGAAANAFSFAIGTQPLHGSVTVAGAIATYTPASNYNGSDSFTFRVAQGALTSGFATVSIAVTAVNDAPTASPQTVLTNVSTSKAITLTGSDPEGSALTYAIVTNPQHGSISGGNGAARTYTPANGYQGLDAFTFRVNDGTLNSAPATVTVEVGPALATWADVMVTLTDAPDPVALGSNVVYTAAVRNNGPATATATTLTLTYPTTDFTFVSAAGASCAGSPLVCTLGAIPNGGTVNVALTLKATNRGGVTVTTSANVSATEFDYSTANNGSTQSTSISGPTTPTADLSVSQIASPNPVAFGANVAYTITVTNLGPSHATGVTLTSAFSSATATFVSATGAQGLCSSGPGQVSCSVGSLASGASTSYTVTLQASGSGSINNTATVSGAQTDVPGNNSATTTVGVINRAPTASLDVATTNEDTAVAIAVLANDTDPDGDTLSVTGVTQPSDGSATVNPDNTITYSPAPNDNGGPVSFSYTISDGHGNLSTALVRVSVLAVNDVPTYTMHGGTLTYSASAVQRTFPNWASSMSAGPADEAGQTLNFIVANNNHQLFSVQPSIDNNGTLSLTPSATATPGVATVTVWLQDNGGTANGGVDTTAPRTFTIAVNANHAPTATDDAYSVNEDATLTVDASGVNGLQGLLFNDNDPDPDATLTAVYLTNPAHGTLLPHANGSFSYTPAANYNGPDSFTYQASDGSLTSNIVTVHLTVTAVNDPPVANPDSATVLEDRAIGIDVLANDSSSPDTGETLRVLSTTQPLHGFALLCAPAPSGMTAWWSGDGDANDVAGTNHGTAAGGVTFVPGKVGTAFSFNGVDGIVTTPLTVNYAGGASFQAWIRTSADSGTVMSDGGGVPASSGMSLFVAGGRITLSGSNGTGTLNFQITGPTVNDGNYHHVAATWTGTTAANGVKLYVDGLQIGSATAVAPISSGTTPINIGWHPVDSTHGPFNGQIDEVQVYAGALTAQDVGQSMAMGVAGFCKRAPAGSAAGTATGTWTGTVSSSDGNTDHTYLFLQQTGAALTGATVDGTTTFAGSLTGEVGGVQTYAVTVTETVAGAACSPSTSTGTFTVDTTNNTLAASLFTAQTVDCTADVTETAALLRTPGVGTGVVYFPEDNFNGSDSFTYTVGDGHGGTATATVNVTVTPVNDPPVFSFSPSFPNGFVSRNEDAGPITINGFLTNIKGGPTADELSQTVTFTLNNTAPPGFFTAPPAIDSTGKLTYQVAPNKNNSDTGGPITVFIRATDNGGTAFGGNDTNSFVSFQIATSPVNDPPTFTISAATVTRNEDSNFSSVPNFATVTSKGATNEGGQSVNFVVSNDNNALFSGQPNINQSGQLSFSPAFNAYGSATVTVIARDTGGTGNGGNDTSAPQTFTITVTPVNDKPSFVPTSNVFFVFNNAGVQSVSNFITNILVGPANESNGSCVPFDPAVCQQTPTFTVTPVSNASAFSVLPSVSANGTLTYTPSPTANDPSGNQVTANFNLVLTDNGGTANGGQDTAPTFPFSIVVKAPLAISTTPLSDGVLLESYFPCVQATGAFTLPLTYSITSGSLPPGLTLNATSTQNPSAFAGCFTGAPIGATGTYGFTVQVKDSSVPQQTATRSLSIDVDAVDQQPFSTQADAFQVPVPTAPNRIAQTLTTGATGTLTGLRFSMLSCSAYPTPMTVKIQGVNAATGAPDDTQLFATIPTTVSNGGQFIIPVPSLFFAADTPFAVVASVDSASSNTCQITNAPQTDTYLAGGAFVDTGGGWVTSAAADLPLNTMIQNSDLRPLATNAGQVRTVTLGTVGVPDGRILVVDSQPNPQTGQAVAQTIDPANLGATPSTYALTTGRSEATVTKLSDGTVLIVGGFPNGGSTLASAEIFNPATNTSTATANSMPVARSNHAAVLLTTGPNAGKVLITGGQNSSNFGLQDAYLFDPNGQTFTSVGPMVSGRSQHTMTVLADGRVLIAGGFINGQGATAEIYDPGTSGNGTFTATGGLLTPRANHVATPLFDNTVLVTGGQTTSFPNTMASTGEIYTPVASPGTGAFTAAGNMIEGRLRHTATLLADHTVLLTGGQRSPNGSTTPWATAERYVPGASAGFEFVGAPAPIVTRYDHGAVLLATGPSAGQVALIGGNPGMNGSRQAGAGFEVYDPDASSAGTPAISNPILANAVLGSGYTANLFGTGGTGPTYTFSLVPPTTLPPATPNALPPGLTLINGPSHGSISGTPTAAGVYVFDVSVTDGVRSSVQALRLSVSGLVITTTNLPNGTVGVPYNTTLAATGIGSKTWSLLYGSLPTGLTLNSDGTITGTPTTATSNFAQAFTVRVQDAQGQVTTGAFYLFVKMDTAPVATPDAYQVSRNTTLMVDASGSNGLQGLLFNDFDTDPGTTLTAIYHDPNQPADGLTNPSHGTLLPHANGSFSYTPDTGYVGPDSFTYKVTDGAMTSNIATVNITVTPALLVPTSYATIQAAINAATNGDTVQVAAGTYHENLVWNNKAITIVGAGAATTIVDGGHSSSVLKVSGVPQTSSVTGFTFRNGEADYNVGWGKFGGGVLLQNSPITIADSIVTLNHAGIGNDCGGPCGGGGAGIALFHSDATIVRTTVSSNTALSEGGGVDAQKSSPILRNDVITGNYPNGVFSFNDNGYVHNTVGPVVVDTLIADNTNTGSGGAGIAIWGSALALINTTVTGNSPGGFIESDPWLDTVTIDNSILWGNPGAPDLTTGAFASLPSEATVNYSIVGTGYFSPGTAVSSADPLFVNAGAGNYRLQSSSPAVNNGRNTVLPGYATTDLDGNPRIVSADVDMGAYEDQNAADGPVHHAPTANAQTVSTTTNVPKAITLVGSDPDGQPMTFSVVGNPANGSLSGSGANRTYTPNNGFTGDDAFTFQVTDPYRASAAATVTIHVNAPVNTAPTATAQTVYLNEDNAPGFTSVGPMTTVHVGHVSVPLNDGRVLIAGSDNFTQVAELFDPSTSSFTATGSLVQGRCYGCGWTKLADGRVFVVGGWTGGSALTTAEIYDPTTSSFHLTNGTMTAQRLGPTATLLADGTVLVVGGHNGYLFNASTEIFNPMTGTFSLTANNLNSARSGATVRLNDGRVLLAGGQTDGNVPLATAEIYDPSSGLWSPTNGPMTRARDSLAAVLLGDGRVLIAGGSGPSSDVAHTADVFDPSTGTFTLVGPMADDHVYAVATLLPSGKVAIFGGSGTTTSVEEFDPSTNTFTRVADMTVARAEPGVALLADGRVLVTGGIGASNQRLSSAEIYTPSGAIHITLAGTDAETASFNLSFTVTTSPLHGALSGMAPNLVYTPNGNYNGSDSFQFTVTDRGAPDNCGTPSGTCAGALTSAATTVSIVVRPVNDVPVANAGSVSTNENTPVAVTLTGGDLETGVANLVYTVTTQPSNGSLSGTAPNLTYTPAANYSGSDSFTFTVTDRGDPDSCGSPSTSCAAALTSTATISITVNAVGGPTPFDISGLLNADVVINSSHTSGSPIDGSNYAYMTASEAVFRGLGSGAGLPDNGMIPADGNHPTVQLYSVNTSEGNNVRLSLTPETYTIAVPNRPYSQAQLYAVATEGSTTATVTLRYSDASTDTRVMSVPDWTSGGPGANEFTVVSGLARESNGNHAVESFVNAKIFGLNLNPNPAKTLVSIDVSKPLSDGHRLVLFAAGGQ